MRLLCGEESGFCKISLGAELCDEVVQDTSLPHAPRNPAYPRQYCIKTLETPQVEF